MARVNITVPHDLMDRARRYDLNVSAAAAAGIAAEVERVEKMLGLEALLGLLDAEDGPPTPGEAAAAATWAARVVGEDDRDSPPGVHLRA